MKTGDYGLGRKAQGLSVNAIILIVLGIFVLVLLVIGFTVGWSKIGSLFSSNNVDTISTACSTACATQSNYDFCTSPRDVKGISTPLSAVTCNYLSKKQPSLGINTCDALPCDTIILSNATTATDAQSSCTGNIGKTVQYLANDNSLMTITCA